MREKSSGRNGGADVINNVESLKGKARTYSKHTGLSVQQVLQNFMFERFLERLSHSRYKKNFIVKGGCLLSAIMGLDMRTTTDIDVNITGIDFNYEQMHLIIQEILKIELEDEVSFELKNAKDIKEEKEYHGYRFSLVGIYANLRIPFNLDTSTGDVIIPVAIEYRYKKILEDEYIDIIAYNIESVIAEKLQTILSLKIGNSRMKDYYDLYYFLAIEWELVHLENLQKAIAATFIKRNTLDDLEKIDDILATIETDQTMNELWLRYSEIYSFANGVRFKDIVKVIRKIGYL